MELYSGKVALLQRVIVRNSETESHLTGVCVGFEMMDAVVWVALDKMPYPPIKVNLGKEKGSTIRKSKRIAGKKLKKGRASCCE